MKQAYTKINQTQSEYIKKGRHQRYNNLEFASGWTLIIRFLSLDKNTFLVSIRTSTEHCLLRPTKSVCISARWYAIKNRQNKSEVFSPKFDLLSYGHSKE